MNNKQALPILFICDDDGLRFSRESMLKDAGYEVKWLPSNATLDAGGIRRSSVAIICESVAWKRASHLCSTLKRLNPAMKVLRLNTLRSEMENAFDVDCEVIPGPGALVQVLDSLSHRPNEFFVISR